MTLPTADDFTPVTTHARRKRHWAVTAELRTYGSGSRTGSTLCDGYGGSAMDQQRADEGMPARWRNRTIVTDLPPCKQCDKSRARRMEGRPS